MVALMDDVGPIPFKPSIDGLEGLGRLGRSAPVCLDDDEPGGQLRAGARAASARRAPQPVAPDATRWIPVTAADDSTKVDEQTQTEDVRDSSVSIGLRVLNEVVAEWTGQGARLEANAIFVEANPKSHRALEAHVERTRGAVEAHVLPGEFGANVPEIRRLLGGDPAFIFVDPTGWKGVGMKYIAQLVDQPFRDVMINFMFQYLNRFKGEEQRDWLRRQVCEFFGIEDNAELRGLGEAALLEVYRNRLKELSGLTFALDLAIPDPLRDRPFFHLVCGGRHRDVVALFREVEAAVVGGEAALVRREARQRKDSQRTLSLFDTGASEAPTSEDVRYRHLRDEGLHIARRRVEAALEGGPRRFGDLWPEVLEVAHIRRLDLRSLLDSMVDEGRILVEGMKPRERTINDDHVLRRVES
jgi:three-Cys-motif partner protein